jgi:hypothetical protein
MWQRVASQYAARSAPIASSWTSRKPTLDTAITVATCTAGAPPTASLQAVPDVQSTSAGIDPEPVPLVPPSLPLPLPLAFAPPPPSLPPWRRSSPMTVAGQPAMPVAVSVSGPRPILLTAAPSVGGTLVTSDRLPLNIRLMLALGGDPDPGTYDREWGRHVDRAPCEPPCGLGGPPKARGNVGAPDVSPGGVKIRVVGSHPAPAVPRSQCKKSLCVTARVWARWPGDRACEPVW